MDKETFCHNIASIASKMYISSNEPEYKSTGYSKLVTDLSEKYTEAYNLAEKEYSKTNSQNSKSNNMICSNKQFI